MLINAVKSSRCVEAITLNNSDSVDWYAVSNEHMLDVTDHDARSMMHEIARVVWKTFSFCNLDVIASALVIRSARVDGK